MSPPNEFTDTFHVTVFGDRIVETLEKVSRGKWGHEGRTVDGRFSSIYPGPTGPLGPHSYL